MTFMGLKKKEDDRRDSVPEGQEEPVILGGPEIFEHMANVRQAVAEKLELAIREIHRLYREQDAEALHIMGNTVDGLSDLDRCVRATCWTLAAELGSRQAAMALSLFIEARRFAGLEADIKLLVQECKDVGERNVTGEPEHISAVMRRLFQRMQSEKPDQGNAAP